MTRKKQPPVKGRRTTVAKKGDSLKNRVEGARQARTKTTPKMKKAIAKAVPIVEKEFRRAIDARKKIVKKVIVDDETPSGMSALNDPDAPKGKYTTRAELRKKLKDKIDVPDTSSPALVIKMTEAQGIRAMAMIAPNVRKPIKINMGGGKVLSRGMLRSMEDRINGGWGVAELVDGKYQFVDGERFERQDDASTYQEVVEAMRS